MRNADRLDLFYDKAKEIHYNSFQDYRFGQLMINFFGWLNKKGIDPFFVEEDKMIKLFIEFANTTSCWYRNNK